MKAQELNRIKFLYDEFKKYAELDMALEGFKVNFCDKVVVSPDAPLQKGIVECRKATQAEIKKIQDQLAEAIQDVGVKLTGN